MRLCNCIYCDYQKKTSTLIHIVIKLIASNTVVQNSAQKHFLCYCAPIYTIQVTLKEPFSIFHATTGEPLLEIIMRLQRQVFSNLLWLSEKTLIHTVFKLIENNTVVKAVHKNTFYDIVQQSIQSK